VRGVASSLLVLACIEISTEFSSSLDLYKYKCYWLDLGYFWKFTAFETDEVVFIELNIINLSLCLFLLGIKLFSHSKVFENDLIIIPHNDAIRIKI
jgi:hypothetical protein